MKKYTALVLLLCVSCGVKKNLVQNLPLDNAFPKVNETATVELGVTLVSSEKGFVYNALKINEDRKVKPGNFTRVLMKGELFLNKYETADFHLFESPSNNSFGIALSKNGGKQKFYSDTSDGVELIELNAPIDVTATVTPVKSKEYFKQEFIYNGKVGNGIKFIYREYVDDYARPAFTQELQYDLSESTTIGFRKLRIEVIDANNIQIKYRLLNQF